MEKYKNHPCLECDQGKMVEQDSLLVCHSCGYAEAVEAVDFVDVDM